MFTTNKMDCRLREYLEEIFGCAQPLQKHAYAVPLGLREYAFYDGGLLGVPIVFAISTGKMMRTPMELRHAYEQIKTKVGREAVFVFAQMGTQRRNQLVRYAVPFIVPKQQMFFPPYIRFQERVPRVVRDAVAISPMAQAMVIRELVCRDAEGKDARELAELLESTKMTMGNVVAELASHDVCNWDESWPRRLVFKVRGRLLWEKMLPQMRSPVLKVVYNALPGGTECVEAGLSAMARRTMLAPDDLPVFACTKDTLRDSTQYVKSAYRDEAKSELQVWRYRPDICKKGEVDALSLYLSMKDDDDPRLQKELETMMEGFQWS